MGAGVEGHATRDWNELGKRVYCFGNFVACSQLPYRWDYAKPSWMCKYMYGCWAQNALRERKELEKSVCSFCCLVTFTCPSSLCTLKTNMTVYTYVWVTESKETPLRTDGKVLGTSLPFLPSCNKSLTYGTKIKLNVYSYAWAQGGEGYSTIA